MEHNVFWTILGILLALITLPGTIELLILTVGGVLPFSKGKNGVSLPPQASSRLVVLIPAYNEEIHIARTLQSLKQCGDSFDVVVVADNCTDRTAEISERSGALVILRNDLSKKGKNYALDYAFTLLLAKGYEFFVVIDADTVVKPNFITVIRQLFQRGADAIQTYYGVLNPDQSMRTRLMNVAFLAFNLLRPKGRQRWGFSAGILGNGFALRREILVQVPYQIDSVVEDVAYHLRLVAAGKRVIFTDATCVLADMPVKGKGVITQRVRWEGGRFQLIAKEATNSFREICKGKSLLWEPFLDLLLLPLGYHAILLIILLIIPFPATQIYAIISLAIIACHLVCAIIIGGGSLKDFIALGLIPFYLIWKLGILLRILVSSKRGMSWNRTERSDQNHHKL
jgi:cellulose synthase/poly-beta-1,6-N-acetylglucosamine synthase-like glycosyltransferase